MLYVSESVSQVLNYSQVKWENTNQVHVILQLLLDLYDLDLEDSKTVLRYKYIDAYSDEVVTVANCSLYSRSGNLI